MTIFSLGLSEHVPAAGIASFGRNLLLAGLGDLVSGGLLVGAVYGVLGPVAPEVAEPEVVAA